MRVNKVMIEGGKLEQGMVGEVPNSKPLQLPEVPALVT